MQPDSRRRAAWFKIDELPPTLERNAIQADDICLASPFRPSSSAFVVLLTDRCLTRNWLQIRSE